MTLSAVFILDSKGKPLISRNYRGDVDCDAALKVFSTRLLNSSSSEIPIFTDSESSTTFVSLRHKDVFVVSVTKRNVNAASALQYQVNLIRVLQSYFKNVDAESVKDNFVIIYELLDEMMDFGYPQTTEFKILQEYITQSGFLSDFNLSSKNSVRPPTALTNAVSWRSEGVVHRKNEIFLDVVERLNLTMSCSGEVLNSEVEGVIKMKSYLSGMPELKLGLNDKLLFQTQGKSGKSVEMDDVKFHQCVRLARFESDRTISFVPPDGAFDLMSYRLESTTKPLFFVEVVVEAASRSRIKYLVKVSSQFKARSVANNVEIAVPVPDDVDTPSFKASVGSVTYVPDKDAVVWSIKQFAGSKKYLMQAQFGLPSTSKSGESSEWKRPIKVGFEIPYYTVSGISVRFLKIVEKSGYTAAPWVRYLTLNGDYAVKMQQ